MSIALTFEELEQHVAQLPPDQQLRLVAHISAKLSDFLFNMTPLSQNQEQKKKQARPVRIDAWLAECDRVADLWQGPFDSVADLRRIRDEE